MDGTWTIDMLTEYAEKGYADLNGNGIEDAGDLFGSMKSDKMTSEMRNILSSFNLNLYTMKDGILNIDFNAERCVLAIEKLSKYNCYTPGIFHSDLSFDSSGKYFAQNYSIFFPASLRRTTSSDFRNMSDPYGILPSPKLDEPLGVGVGTADPLEEPLEHQVPASRDSNPS